MHNSELADIVGNLVHRALNLCNKYCGGEIPCVSHDGSFEMPFSVDKLVEEVTADVKNCNLNLALFKGMEAARSTNGYCTASLLSLFIFLFMKTDSIDIYQPRSHGK